MGLISNGTTIFDNGAMASGFGGSMTFISSQTASASASIEFTTGIDSTYKEYQFYFINCHPASDGVTFTFNMSTDGGTNYNVTKTTTFFRARHYENDSTADLSYSTGADLAQSTAFQTISINNGNDNDQALSGSLTLFNPSSTVFVKHFIATTNNSTGDNVSSNNFTAGYGNTTSAVNAVQFKMSSGNIDDGTILLYGIK
jgi:hypothetical protein